MPEHALGPGDALHFDHQSPAAGNGVTFVFFNPLTGDAASWEASVAEPLRAEGHGSLLFNFRGQSGSPFGARPITAQEIVADARALISAQRPRRPVYVGLSIGGLFAARAHLEGMPCLGLLLINTLRTSSTRLDWLNAAVHRCAMVGGGELLRDLFSPLLMGPAWQEANRAAFLKAGAYQPLAPESGTAKLLAASATADWDLPYEQLAVPVIVLSGLQDRVFYDAVDVAGLARRLPNAIRIDLPDAGHLIPMERPDAVVDACLALARRVS